MNHSWPTIRSVATKYEAFLKNWWLLVLLSSVGVVIGTPAAIHAVVARMSDTDSLNQVVSERSAFVENAAGEKIGWWQVTYHPHMLPHGSEAFEVTYSVNQQPAPSPTSAAAVDDDPERSSYLRCLSNNAFRGQWNQAPTPCTPPAESVGQPTTPIKPIVSVVPVVAIKSLSVSVRHSDFSVQPPEMTISFNVDKIFRSPSLSDNTIWTIRDDDGVPGVRNIVLSFDVQPPEFQIKRNKINDEVREMHGSQFSFPVYVQTKYAVSQVTSDYCALLIQGVSAICGSSVFLLLIKRYTDRRSPKPRVSVKARKVRNQPLRD